MATPKKKRRRVGVAQERKEQAPGWPVDPGLRRAVIRRLSQPGAPSKAEIGRKIGVSGQRLSQIFTEGSDARSCPELPTVLSMLSMPMSLLPGLSGAEAQVIELLHSVPENLRREWPYY